MKVLVPFSTHPPLFLEAVMRALPASEPEEGSVNPQAPMNSPVASFETYFFFWASLPARKMWFAQSEVWAATMMPTDPSTRESSSMAVTYSTYPMPAPPYSGGKIAPIRPSLPSSLIVARGNSAASSHFMMLGAISRSANSRTLFFRWSCSSLSWKSKKPPYGAHANAQVTFHLSTRSEDQRNVLTDRLGATSMRRDAL